VSERFLRRAEVVLLLGDPTKAKEVLGWDPDKLTSVQDLCNEMVDGDIDLGKLELAQMELKKQLKVSTACLPQDARQPLCCQAAMLGHVLELL